MSGKPPILLSLWSRPSACRGLSLAEKGDKLLCPAPEASDSSQHHRSGQSCLSPFSVQHHRPPPSVARRSLRSAGTLACRIDTRADARSTRGQALIEFALMVPLLFLLIVLTVNFGGLFYAWIEVENATRAAANYAILGDPSVGDPTLATGPTLVTLINDDLASLPNSISNTSAAICQNNNGTITTIATAGSGSCPSSLGTVTADPDPTDYTSVSVDITYQYSPFIPVFSFSGLGIGLPGMPTTIHRRTVMRMLI